MDNVSAVRILTLSGINETMNYRIAIFSLTLLYYSLILVFNISLIAVIISDENLHEPMYVLLCSFCINGLYGTTGFYPKFLSDLLSSSSPEISYEGCLLQAFVMYSFACCDLSILAVMAYDRKCGSSPVVCYCCSSSSEPSILKTTNRGIERLPNREMYETKSATPTKCRCADLQRSAAFFN
ncbi:putative olfactory receptor 142-like [Scophthalmus maximus]|uniref:Putative olfactory receptor 142-like n=1 Tax=Scophthalmus maximus TaxID=52904 RepID=A0A2U9C8W1_SCOMX|nr:putative olfactory receptor 142-like [Scophthalmus maximus]